MLPGDTDDGERPGVLGDPDGEPDSETYPRTVGREPVAAAEEGPSTVTVTIADAGAAKVAVIKVVKEITGLGLKESKDIVDSNGVVKEHIAKAEADEIKAK